MTRANQRTQDAGGDVTGTPALTPVLTLNMCGEAHTTPDESWGLSHVRHRTIALGCRRVHGVVEAVGGRRPEYG